MPRKQNQPSSSSPNVGFSAPLDDSVSALRTSARALREIAEILQKFPFVKPIAGLTAIVCEIFENVQSNNEQWDIMGKQALSFIVAVTDKQCEDPAKVIGPSLLASCEELTKTLETVRTQMKKLSTRNPFKKVLKNSTDKDLRVAFRQFLDDACTKFQIQVLMDIDMKTVKLQATVKHLHDELSSYITKLTEVQASTIKIGERQLLDRLSSVSDVQYNPDKLCAVGTRLRILHDIETWASNFSPPLVASLRGKAGIGKSTVAHTVAAAFSEAGCLAASYFFSRDVAISRPLKNLLPEISRQLAIHIPPFRRALCEALEKDDFPVFPRQQLSKLLTEPLRASLHSHAKKRPWIIILDALDECEDDIRDCVLLLTESLAEFQGKLKLVVTSRPEAAIDAVQQLRQTHVLNIDIASPENESDLRTYFQLRLRPLWTRPGWPSADPIPKLVLLAGGLFVWAAVVTSFLLESDILSEEIELVLNGTHWEDNPEKRLAQMYGIILEKAYNAGKRTDHFKFFLPVLATLMVVHEPQSDMVIGHLVAEDLRHERLRGIIEGLSAALHIPPESPVVRVTHPSFYRYLTGNCQDTRFAVDPVVQSKRLGQRCLAIVLKGVHRDMCNLMELSHVPQNKIADLHERIVGHIPCELQYACNNWILHTISDPNSAPDEQLESLLRQFFQSRLLPWIEVIGLLGRLSTVSQALTRLFDWLKKFKPLDHILVQSTMDALKFLREFNHIISLNAIQVHVSAAHFSPRSSTIWKNYIDLPRQPVFVKSGADIDWPAAQTSLESNIYSRLSIKFSPDGHLLAETGDPMTKDGPTRVVQIWDISSCSLVTSLDVTIVPSHVEEVVFTPDSRTLIFAGLHAVIVWSFWKHHDPDIYTVLAGAENASVAVAPNGSHFALGSLDHDIVIWQVTPRAKISYYSIGRGCPLSLTVGSGVTSLLCHQNIPASQSTTTLKCWHSDLAFGIDVTESGPIAYMRSLSTDGLLVLSISESFLCVHNSKTGVLIFEYALSDSNILKGYAFSPDAEQLALATEEGNIFWIHIIEACSGRFEASYHGVVPLAWSPSSTTLAWQDSDGTTLVWERSTVDDLLLTLPGDTNADIRMLAFCPDGQYLAYSHGKGDISLLHLALFSSQHGDDSQSRDDHFSVTDFVISSNGRRLAALFDSAIIKIYDASTGEEETMFKTRFTDANHMEFSMDANFIALTFEPITGDFTISARSSSRQSEVWSITSSRVVYHSSSYQLLRFCPSSHQLVCASFRRALRINLLDIDTVKGRGSEIPLSDIPLRVYPLAFSRSQNVVRLAAVDLDHEYVHVWDITKSVPLGLLEVPQHYLGASITQLALSADGKTLAATSARCILIWSIEQDGSPSPRLMAHRSFELPGIHLLSFSPDNRELAYTAEAAMGFWDIVNAEFANVECPSGYPWQGSKEWHSEHYFSVTTARHYCILYHMRQTGLPLSAQNRGSSVEFRHTEVDGYTNSKFVFSQPGLQVSVPSHKQSISPLRLRLNESLGTVSWYWIQKDGRLFLLELPAP